MTTTHSKAIRFLTIVFGGLPILVLLPMLALWLIMAGSALDVAVDSSANVVLALVLLAWGMLGLWGAYALWAAAIGPVPVQKPTAIGLVVGIAAMTLLLAFVAYMYVVEEGQVGAPDPFALWLTVGPLAVAVWHVYQFIRYAQNRRLK